MLSGIQKNLILTVSSVVISLVLAVGAYEVYKHHQYKEWKSYYQGNKEWYGGLTIASTNPVLMWEYRVNGQYRDFEFGFEIKTNRYGFRDRDYDSTKKPHGFFRVAFIGDSVTLGFKVESDSILVRKFEMYANQMYTGFVTQALNFGVDGYNTIQIYELLKSKVLSFEPDKVVYMMSLNDFDLEGASGQKIRYFKKPKSFFIVKIEELRKRLSNKDYHLYHFDKNKHIVFRTIVEMKDLLKIHRTDFQIVILPVFAHSEKNFQRYALAHMHSEIARILNINAVEVLDLLDRFNQQDKPPQFYAHDIWHPNKAGHDFIAEQILQSVFKEKFPLKGSHASYTHSAD
jgi:lysophospholipase L1-like esterase